MPRRSLKLIAALALASAGALAAQTPRYGFGKPMTADDVKRVDIAVGPNGEGLPLGSGSASEGAQVFQAKCSVCHGKEGEGGPYDRLAGGEKPVKTIGSYWPYATTVFDYTRRAMPFNKPGSLTDAEVYSVTAWLLWKNGIIPENAIMDAKSLPLVKMPNRNGFVPDPRPEFRKETPKTPAKNPN